MAKLVKTNLEVNPDNEHGVVLFAYFDGTPSVADLERLVKKNVSADMQEFAKPEKVQNELADRARLERWLIGDPG